MTNVEHLLKANKKIIYKAVSRAGIRQNAADFDDWVSFAMMQYVRYYERKGARSDEAFNVSVGKLLFMDIRKKRAQLYHKQKAEVLQDEIPETSVESALTIDVTEVETREHLWHLAPRLSLYELIVVAMRMAGINNAEIGKELGVSRARISQIRKHVEIVDRGLADA